MSGDDIRHRVTLGLTCLLLPFAFCAASASGGTVRGEQVAFARGLVAALQSKDETRVISFFHPSVRACMTDRNRSFFTYVIAQQVEGFPSGGYSKITVTPVKKGAAPAIWAFLPAKEFPFPVMPTYDIQLDFNSAPDGLFSDMLEVAPSGRSWYLVAPCPNAEGMRLMQTMQLQGARQKAQAKLLAAKIHGPLLQQLKQLLSNGDKVGAVKAYQKATGADITTAVAVIGELENRIR